VSRRYILAGTPAARTDGTTWCAPDLGFFFGSVPNRLRNSQWTQSTARLPRELDDADFRLSPGEGILGNAWRLNRHGCPIGVQIKTKQQKGSNQLYSRDDTCCQFKIMALHKIDGYYIKAEQTLLWLSHSRLVVPVRTQWPGQRRLGHGRSDREPIAPWNQRAHIVLPGTTDQRVGDRRSDLCLRGPREHGGRQLERCHQ